MSTESKNLLKPIPLGRLVLRAAAAFGLAGATGFAVGVLLNGDSPLSDDPYLVGFLFGGVAAATATNYTLFETFVRRRGLLDFLHFGLLAVWALLLVASEGLVIEGHGYPTLFAIASLIAGTIAWPVCRFHVPRWFIVGGALVGAAMTIAYFVVAARMANRREALHGPALPVMRVAGQDDRAAMSAAAIRR